MQDKNTLYPLSKETILEILGLTWFYHWQKQHRTDSSLTNEEWILWSPRTRRVTLSNPEECIRLQEEYTWRKIICTLFLLIMAISVLGCLLQGSYLENVLGTELDTGIKKQTVVTLVFPVLGVLFAFGLAFMTRNMFSNKPDHTILHVAREWSNVRKHIEAMGIVPRLQESYLVRPDIQHSISFRKGVIVDTEIGNWLFNQFAEHVKATSGKSLVMSVLPGHTESERRTAEEAFSRDLELAKVFRSPHKEKELRGMLYSGARTLVRSEGLM